MMMPAIAVTAQRHVNDEQAGRERGDDAQAEQLGGGDPNETAHATGHALPLREDRLADHLQAERSGHEIFTRTRSAGIARTSESAAVVAIAAHHGEQEWAVERSATTRRCMRRCRRTVRAQPKRSQRSRV